MGRSSALRQCDIVEALRLVGECRDARGEPAAWVGIAIAGLRRLTNSQMVSGGVVPRFGVEPFLVGGNCWDVGWSDDRLRAEWVAKIHTPSFVGQLLTVQRLFATPGRLVTRRREQLIPNREWDQSEELNEERKPLDQDDVLNSIHRFDGGAGLQLFCLNREWGAARYSERERRFVRLFTDEIGRLLGTVLAIEPGGPLARLSPRLRQVLRSLAEGDSEKQVAARLGISRHTVHDYVTELHTRLGVANRAELVAVYWRYRTALPTATTDETD